MAPATQRKIRIAAFTAALLLVFGLVIQPLAIRLAQATATERGWTLSVRRVRLGMRGLWFKELRATRPAVADFQVALDAVLVPWSKLASRNAFFVVGGTVELPAQLERLAEDLSAHSRSARGGMRPRQLSIRISGLTAHWPGEEQAGAATVWGLSGELAPQSASLRFDRAQFARGETACVLTGADASLQREPSGWKLALVKVEQARLEMRTGGDAPSPLAPQPSPSPSPSPSSAKASSKTSVKTRTPSADRVAPSPPSLDALERVVVLAQSLRTHASRLRQFIGERLTTRATAEISNVNLKWTHAKQSLNIGPFRAQSHRDANGLALALEQGSGAADERRFVELQVPLTPSRIEFKSEISFVSLKDLGVQEADFGLQHVDAAKLRLKVQSAIDELVASANVAISGEVQDLSVLQPWLASRPVTGINAEFSGNAGITWGSGSALRIDDLSLRVGQARVEIGADIQRSGHETRAKVDLNVPLAACGDLVESLPSGLAPLASQVKLDGTVALQAGISFDTEHPQRADAKWELSNSCRVRGASPLVSPERFREPFILEVPDANGAMTERAFGPGTPNWVPYADMTPQLTNAILVCEDGRFFYHHGFDSQAIRSSIRENLLRGRFIRGGSTVTMQLAKNLYLRREKTFSRKLQEAALTLLLEQSFSKNEIMELYWNVVELGPGIYGVGEASKFYFGTAPAALTPAQAFYLGSILPNPKALHFSPGGNVSPGWLSQVRKLMGIAHARHYLTDEELRVSLEEQLHFGDSGDNSQASISAAAGDQATGSQEVREGGEHELSP